MVAKELLYDKPDSCILFFVNIFVAPDSIILS